MKHQEKKVARGSGQSTGLMLKAIGDACLNPLEYVEFIDHAKHNQGSAEAFAYVLDNIKNNLNLKIEIKREGSRVFIKSLIQ